MKKLGLRIRKKVSIVDGVPIYELMLLNNFRDPKTKLPTNKIVRWLGSIRGDKTNLPEFQTKIWAKFDDEVNSCEKSGKMSIDRDALVTKLESIVKRPITKMAAIDAISPAKRRAVLGSRLKHLN